MKKLSGTAALLSWGLLVVGPPNGRCQKSAPQAEVNLGIAKVWGQASGNTLHAAGDTTLTVSFNHVFGLELDFNAHGGAADYDRAYGPEYGFLLGPHFTLRTKSHLSPFEHVLVGMMHGVQNCPFSPSPLGCDAVDWFAPTADVGAGLDVRISRSFWIRPVQADFVHMFFLGTGRYRENSLQLSCGITFRLGRRVHSSKR